MKLRIPYLIVAAGSVVAFAMACSEEEEPREKQFPSYCEVTEWECEAFEDGPQLSERRHGHDTVVIDHERVLLIGGSYRPGGDGTSEPFEGCEILNPITDEVRETGCFARTRTNSTIVQLQDKSVLAIGGIGEEFDRLDSAERFDPESETWVWVAGMNIEYRVGNLTPLVLEDGRVFLLRRDDQFGSVTPSHVGAEIYDPEEDTWSAVEGLPEMEVDTLSGAVLPDGKILIVAAEPDELTKSPPEPEEGQEPRHQGQLLHLVLFDVEEESFEVLDTLDERGIGLTPEVTWLSERGYFLINIYGDDRAPTHGYLFDPETYFWEKFYEREPAPGRLITILPGDRALFYNMEDSQYYDLDTDVWWNFDAFSPGTTYSSIVQLDDCRLLASGERTLSGEEAGELRGVDTAYCVPVEAAEPEDTEEESDAGE